MTLEEVIERIKEEALQIASDPQKVKDTLDSEVFIELVLPKCIQEVVKDVTKDEVKLNQLKKEVGLTFAAGSATIPPTLQEDYAQYIYFETYPQASYERDGYDYFNSGHELIPTFHLANGKIYFRPGGGLTTTFAGTTNIMAVLTPALPTLITDQFVINDSLLEELIYFTAKVVAGVPPDKTGTPLAT